MNIVVFSLSLSILSFAPVDPSDNQVKPSLEDSKIATVDVVGKLVTGVMAIGGESTGTIIKVGPIEFEVSVAASNAHQAFAAKHSGQRVRISGALARVKAVERGERWIISPTRLRSVTTNQTKDEVKAVVKGKVRANVQAIGGETTGTTITANGTTWELDLGKKSELIEFVDDADGKNVVVTGILEIRKGVEIRKRWILRTDKIKLASNKKK